MVDVQRLRALLAAATPGEWMLATSCSWRRILTTDGKPVIVPTIQRSDNHPDMDCGDDYANAELAIAAINALPALLAIAEAYNAAPVGIVRETGGSLCVVGNLLREVERVCPVSLDETVRLVRVVGE